jgi:hypothetical protein
MKCRVFDVLVEPVLSYASQIWGPQLFHKQLRSNPFKTKAEKVHASYLRVMTGAGKTVALPVLYTDLHRVPVMFHWVILAARWWGRLADRHAEGHQSLACCAWLEDIQLALSGCKQCWSYQLLHTLHGLGLLQAGWLSQSRDWVAQQSWEEEAVKGALLALWWGRWPQQAGDPRAAPSQGLAMCTYQAWVSPNPLAADPLNRAVAPPHTKLCLPFEVLRAYAQLRVGWARLEVDQGRQRRPVVPRSQRLCRLCCGEDVPLALRQAVLARTGTADNVEDLKHFVAECPVYDDLRAHCQAFPADLYQRLHDPACIPAIFGHVAQESLAVTLFRMKARRAHLLGLHVPTD